MKKLFLSFILLFLPLIIAIFILYFLFPKNFFFVKNLAQDQIAHIYPPFKRKSKNTSIIIKKDTENNLVSIKTNSSILKAVLTNADVYTAICDVQPTQDLNKEFKSCTICPSYTNNASSSYFSSYYYELGSFTKKDENESVFFMHGCSDSSQKGFIILLKKTYGGWRRYSNFYETLFKVPIFSLKFDGISFFVAKHKKDLAQKVQEDLIEFQFTKNQFYSKKLLNTQYALDNLCPPIYTSIMGDLNFEQEKKILTLSLDVLAYPKNASNFECKEKRNDSKNNIHLKKGTYFLHFYQKGLGLEIHKKSLSTLIQLEKSTE